MTYKELLKAGEIKAQENKMEKTAIKSLLLFASGKTPTELYISLENEAKEEETDKFFQAVESYTINKKPVAYIIGYTYFYGYKMKVTDQVLIPRWETEELVSNILIYYDDLFKGQTVDAVDLGTGSGAIAIALKKEEEKINMIATDISLQALEVAKENASLNSADITFYEGSWLEPIKDKKFDIIVSNPPYLTNTEFVEDIVKDNEPHVALYGGKDGLDFYEEILKEAVPLVKDRFFIAFENSYNKKRQLNNIIKKYFPDCLIINLKDSAKRNRMTFIIKK
ncbi:MAG: peptide chain release factor N(5)-glutamine methyltransferase [Bacillales bacterium]|nr:peptide chain release factor N(5)-glutamine methyltransferase [Bacillales bacterium]